MRANMAAFVEWMGAAAPTSSTFRLPGVVASVVPATPQRSIFNSVIYNDGDALLAAHATLDQHYRDCGIAAWTVWLMPEQDRVARALKERGHQFDGDPKAMAMDLRTTSLSAPEGLAATQSQDYSTVANINQLAYGVTGAAFGAALRRSTHPDARFYLAQHNGVPACSVMTLDVDGDCGIYLVATLPTARGQGLTTRLMTRALIEARERGCTTSTLQASPMGFPVYQKMGYETLGTMGMWELRR